MTVRPRLIVLERGCLFSLIPTFAATKRRTIPQNADVQRSSTKLTFVKVDLLTIEEQNRDSDIFFGVISQTLVNDVDA